MFTRVDIDIDLDICIFIYVDISIYWYQYWDRGIHMEFGMKYENQEN